MVATLTGFRAYAAERGYPTPALADDSDAEAALARAGDYISAHYVADFIPSCSAASLEVELATYEAALAELGPNGELLPNGFWNAVYTASDRKVLTEVKGIKWTVVGGEGDAASMMPTSYRVEALLSRCVRRDYNGIGLWAIG